MAIEFTYKGKTWRADTPEEAIALRELLQAGKRVTPAEALKRAFDRIELMWTKEGVTEVLKAIGPNQRQFLRTLLHSSEVSSADVITKLNLDSEIALAGILSGLSKQLGKLGHKPQDVFDIRTAWYGKRKTRSFHLSTDFRSMALQIGWPEKWK